MSNLTKLSWALATLAATVASGCGGARIYAVQTRLAFGDAVESPPEVIAARDPSPVANPNRIAVVWPSRCANETSATQRGDAVSSEDLAAGDCALEMSALERVLLSNGYDVYHWDAIRRRALVNEITPEAAAEQLGIGLLLRVNSLERSGIVPGERASWQRSYLTSDRQHSVGAPATVHPNVADQMDQRALQLENDIAREGRLAVTLDVTAVHAPTGEVSWFYRWTHQDAQQEGISRETFVVCRGQRCVDHSLRAERPGPRSGSTRELTNDVDESGQQRAAYARLMYEAIGDLVGRVRQQESGQPARPAPAAAPTPVAAAPRTVLAQ